MLADLLYVCEYSCTCSVMHDDPSLEPSCHMQCKIPGMSDHTSWNEIKLFSDKGCPWKKSFHAPSDSENTCLVEIKFLHGQE